MQVTGVTLANATGVRLEFFEARSVGLLKEYQPPTILEPGEVASFLVLDSRLDVFELIYNIQTFQGPVTMIGAGPAGWVGGDAATVVAVKGQDRFSTTIDAVLQVDRTTGYPTKFTFDVSRTHSQISQWQISAIAVVFIKGVKSIAQETNRGNPTAPPGFLSENTNQGFTTGFSVYCAPVYGVSEAEACTAFQFLILRAMQAPKVAVVSHHSRRMISRKGPGRT